MSLMPAKMLVQYYMNDTNNNYEQCLMRCDDSSVTVFVFAIKRLNGDTGDVCGL